MLAWRATMKADHLVLVGLEGRRLSSREYARSYADAGKHWRVHLLLEVVPCLPDTRDE
ncbi:UNVERIFIED_CONTAM: hypothetical protein DES50_12223 [Williamsia faeni]